MRIELITVAIIAAFAPSTACGQDRFFLVDNIANRLITGTTDSPANTTVLRQLHDTFWGDLSAGTDLGSILATDVRNNTVFSLSTADGSELWSLTIDRSARSIAYDWDSGILYGLPQTGSSELFTVDLTTGRSTVVGALNIPTNPVGMLGMGYDPVTRRLLVTTNQSELYSVDPMTAQSTLIGNTGQRSLFDVAFNLGDGRMYVTNSGDDSLYKIDRSTAQLTRVGGPYGHSTLGTGLAFAVPGPAGYLLFGFTFLLVRGSRR
jgi:DNA-binding beta-propeller fold protein YncE